ncbi:SEC10/PgrA surface exclusion domain-containing protein [Streptococcus suis]|uniref:SEC10/PgrA surface exclusion domain-containing protein n=1 Tax=Streptococcus suis TaxID=1307 RepID=UPI0038BCC6A1
MKKNMQVLSGVAAAVVSAGVVTSVHAEELPQNMETQLVIEANTTKQATVTESDVTSAKAEQDTAKEAVTKQEEVVAQAQKDVDTAKDVVRQAQTELVGATELVEQATPENISKAKDAVAQAEASVTEATQNLEDRQQAEVIAEQAIKKQEKVVSTVQADVNEKTQAVTEAQKDVDTAQAILDGTGQAEIVAKAEQAEKQLYDTTQALATAQTELAEAKEKDANRQIAIEDATQTLNQTNQVLEAKTQVANEATAQAEETAKQLVTAQIAFQEAENEKNSINTITLSPEYIAALKEYGKTYSKSAKDKLESLIADLRNQNTFKTNPNDSQELLDTNNLSEAVRTELSLFASDLINQIRQLVGTKPTVVTKGALQLADATTDGYVADNWSWNDVGHDIKAVKQAAETLGLKTGGQYYENMFTVSRPQPKMTISQAKAMIYQGLLNFMVGGYEYLHALSIVGLSNDVVYSGVDLSSRQDASSVHFLTVADAHILVGSTFDKTAIENLHTSDQILANYRQAQGSLTQATTANNQAQEAKTKALNEQTAAQAQVATAQSRLATANTVPILTPKAETNLVLAQEAVQKAEAEHKEAQANLANLQADVKVKQANLETAKQALVYKQVILEESKERLSEEQAVLARLHSTNKTKEGVLSAKEQLTTAQTAFKTAQFKWISLEEAPVLLEKVKAFLLKSSTELKTKEAVLTQELEKLSGLKQDEAKASEHYQTVLKVYQEVLEAERQVKLAKEYESILRKGGQPVPVVDETGRVTGYMAAIPRVQVPVAKPISNTTPVKTTKAGLPNTGEQLSVVLPMLGLIGLFGLATTRRKKQS